MRLEKWLKKFFDTCLRVWEQAKNAYKNASKNICAKISQKNITLKNNSLKNATLTKPQIELLKNLTIPVVHKAHILMVTETVVLFYWFVFFIQLGEQWR